MPAKDFAHSKRFYRDLGFELRHDGDDVAILAFGDACFLLQNFDAPGLSGNYMLQLLVEDLDLWWRHIQSLDLATRYGVRAPQAPKLMPWGLRVAYIVDPSGVLWHITQSLAG